MHEVDIYKANLVKLNKAGLDLHEKVTSIVKTVTQRRLNADLSEIRRLRREIKLLKREIKRRLDEAHASLAKAPEPTSIYGDPNARALFPNEDFPSGGPRLYSFNDLIAPLINAEKDIPDVLLALDQRETELELERLRDERLRETSMPAVPQQPRTIPKRIQNEIWRRDQGKCVECGSKENLEFDHIIPVVRGGANTARNIQLLCEKCNRRKSAKEPGAW